MGNWGNLSRAEAPEWLEALKWLGVVLAIGVGYGAYRYLFGQGGLAGAAAPPTATVTAMTPAPLGFPTLLVPRQTILLPVATQSPAVRLAQGAPAPEFRLMTLDGEATLTLSQFAGQPVVINFWASWCIPCRSETPALELAYQEYQSQGLVILGIDSAEQDILTEARAFADEFEVTYPLLWDETDEVLQAYGVLGLPTSVFLDTEGRVQRVTIGRMSDEQIQDFVGEIIE